MKKEDRNVYLKGNSHDESYRVLREHYRDNNECSVSENRGMLSSVNRIYICTKYHVLEENNWLEDLKYECDEETFTTLRSIFIY